MRKFKKGDICMVVENSNGHEFKIGELVIVDFNTYSSTVCKNNRDYWYMKSDELFYIGKL